MFSRTEPLGISKALEISGKEGDEIDEATGLEGHTRINDIENPWDREHT